MNHFHKHPIAHKEQAQLAHMNALHYCAVFSGGELGGVLRVHLIWDLLRIHDM